MGVGVWVCMHVCVCVCVCVSVCGCVCRKTQRSPSVIGRRQAARSKKDAAEERARGWYPSFSRFAVCYHYHYTFHISFQL